MHFLRSSPHEKNFVLLNQQHDFADHGNDARDHFQDTQHLSGWNDMDDIKLDTEYWLGSYCHQTQDHDKGSTTKYLRSRLCPSSHKYLVRRLRKRIAGVACLPCKKHLFNLGRSLPSPVLRPSTSDAVPSKTFVSEVIREKPISVREVRIDASSFENLNGLSPISTSSDVGQVHYNPSQKKKKRKPRQVTRYHNPRVLDPRTSRAALYYSSNSANGYQEYTARGHHANKSSVGRHLEWLKFLA